MKKNQIKKWFKEHEATIKHLLKNGVLIGVSVTGGYVVAKGIYDVSNNDYFDHVGLNLERMSDGIRLTCIPFNGKSGRRSPSILNIRFNDSDEYVNDFVSRFSNLLVEKDSPVEQTTE